MTNPLDEYYMLETIPTNGVESPCVRNCCLNDLDVCVGCHRTLEEILAWGSSSQEDKSQILNRIREQTEQPLPFSGKHL
jgi:predicted Fe-S protein YdhL (DUF1289 family)